MATVVIEYRPQSGTVAVGDEVNASVFHHDIWTVQDILQVLDNGFLLRLYKPDPEPCCPWVEPCS